MPGADHGFQLGVTSLVGALIVSVVVGGVIPEFVDTGLLPPGIFSGLVVISILTAFMTVDASRYWSYAYLAGFACGVFFHFLFSRRLHSSGRLTGYCMEVPQLGQYYFESSSTAYHSEPIASAVSTPHGECQ